MADADRELNIGQSRCILVLGATGGIGSTLCTILAESGSRLFVVGRNPERLTALATELGAPSATFDAMQPAELHACVRRACDAFGRLDGIANCVGSVLVKPAHLTSDEDWDHTINLNLRTAFETVRAAAEVMNEGGSVVLISSVAARVGLPNHEAIAAAKAGVEGLVRSAAATYASRGLRFNAVAPGLVRSNATRRFWENPLVAAGSTAMHPLGRIGEPSDVASLIAWLLNPANNWITGQVISVDGGMATVRGKTK